MKHNPITIFHGDDWSALYIDGKLEYVGDTYLLWDRLEAHYHWDVRDSDDFFIPGRTKNRANVYGSLEELYAGITAEKVRRNEARIAELEAEKAALSHEIGRLRELTP